MVAAPEEKQGMFALIFSLCALIWPEVHSCIVEPFLNVCISECAEENKAL